LNAPADDRVRFEGERGERGERSERGERAPRAGSAEFTRLFINLGSVDEFNRGDLLGYICNNTKISGRTVGKIDVKGVYSFFEVANADVEKVMTGFKGIDFKGREVRIEVSGEGTSTTRPEGERRQGGGGYSGGRPSGGGGYNRDRSSGGGGERREGGFNRERSNAGGERREGGGGGFRDFSGKRREDRPERRKRF